MDHIGEVEKRLWSVADNLRANSNFASNEYFMPVMGLIFLRHAYSRFLSAKIEIEKDLPTRGGKTRDLTKEDFSQRGAIFLQPEAQFDHLVALTDGEDRAAAIITAMESIEADYQTLDGTLPKQEYQEIDNEVIAQLLRTFNDPALEKADGDVFGRIYEYFLTQFADQKAHDGGEFFTPPSIVQTIVNVIEPDHGKIIDPACGSGGMFVQSAHFIERMHQNPNERVTFYGMEKNATTIRLGKMNLAVHGLEGDIQKAISYYEDPHALLGKADFVMANPPFNVDEIDAEKIKDDPRLTFGLPGVNKGGKVSNGNYVWMSYFHSYLSEKGRAGFVMSSQASSAGGGEAKVREAMIKSGDVDVMMSIRGGFFYTRTVPCELWFFDKDKPDAMQDKVLMIDARHIYRKVTRKVFDFTPEQQQNLAAIVWLYRGQHDRFLELVENHQDQSIEAAEESFAPITYYGDALLKLVNELPENTALVAGVKSYQKLADDFAEGVKRTRKEWEELGSDNTGLTKALALIEPISDNAKHLMKAGNECLKAINAHCDTHELNKGRLNPTKALGALKADVVEVLKQVSYFHHHADWLQSRFPEAELCDVEGLVKLVDHTDLKENDWSLTPGRYVGVAAEIEDEDFDFEEAMTEIHREIEELNAEAATLAATIKGNFEDLIL